MRRSVHVSSDMNKANALIGHKRYVHPSKRTQIPYIWLAVSFPTCDFFCVSLDNTTWLCILKHPAIMLLLDYNVVMLLFYLKFENTLNDKIMICHFLCHVCDVIILTSNTRLYTRVNMNPAIQSQDFKYFIPLWVEFKYIYK